AADESAPPAGSSRAADEGRARGSRDTRRVPPIAELDRSARKLTRGCDLRPAAGRRDARCTGRVREIPARDLAAALAGAPGDAPPALRGDPPVPRRQRSRRPAADHDPSLRVAAPAPPGPLSERVLRAHALGVLRAPPRGES